MNEAAGAPSAAPQTANAPVNEAEAKQAAEQKAREDALEGQKRTNQFLNATALAPAPTKKTTSDDYRDRLGELNAKGLLCPNTACRSRSNKVARTVNREGGVVVRYRECLKCGTTFSTEEKPRN